MSITAAPTLSVAGAPVATSLAGSPALVAIDELRLTWGRGSVLEQPKATTAALTVLDRSAGAVFARRTDLIGAVVVLGWSTSTGATGTNFRGRITDVDVSPLPGAVAGGGFRVALSASSIEVDLANYTLAEGSLLPAESFAARASRLVGLIPAGLIAGGLNLPDRFSLGMQNSTLPDTNPLDGYPAAQMDAGGANVLALIRQLYSSFAPLPAVYDPAGDRYTFAARRLFVYSSQLGMTQSAQLLPDPDHGGRYVPAALSGLHLDAGRTAYSGALGQRLDNRLTRVEVKFRDQANAYADRTAVYGTTDTATEASTGRRAWSVDTMHADVTKALQLAQMYSDLASVEGRSPRLGPVGWSSDREPLHTAAHAALLLATAESSATLFLGGSWLPQLGLRPLVGIIGGLVSYRGGVWGAEFTPAPVVLDPRPNTWAPLTIGNAGTPAVRLRDLDPSTTFGDTAYLDIGAGFTPSTALPYKGNPL